MNFDISVKFSCFKKNYGFFVCFCFNISVEKISGSGLDQAMLIFFFCCNLYWQRNEAVELVSWCPISSQLESLSLSLSMWMCNYDFYQFIFGHIFFHVACLLWCNFLKLWLKSFCELFIVILAHFELICFSCNMFTLLFDNE